jgi:NADPH-dependent 2,4-dienoyl-CoA reductase/sulfur reductase-like enzyme
MTLISNPCKIIVAGGSYAGLSFIQSLRRLASGIPLAVPLHNEPVASPPLGATLERPLQFILVDERDVFFHSVGTPLAHVARPFVEPFWKRFKDIPQLDSPCINVRKTTVKHVDLAKRRIITFDAVTGRETLEEYDYLVLATGLTRNWPMAPNASSKNEYIEAALDYINQIENSADQTAVVLGGGMLFFCYIN